ncbi:hypothetical protein D3C86_2023030 [compost metagenome]
MACALLPVAMALLPVATAFGPMATLSAPMALESASFELAWKYLMPVPPVVRLLIAWFVALSWLPFTASVLVALISPAATLVIWRSAPLSPTLTTPTGLVPANS